MHLSCKYHAIMNPQTFATHLNQTASDKISPLREGEPDNLSTVWNQLISRKEWDALMDADTFFKVHKAFGITSPTGYGSSDLMHWGNRNACDHEMLSWLLTHRVACIVTPAHLQSPIFFTIPWEEVKKRVAEALTQP